MHLLSSDDLSKDNINRIFGIADAIVAGKEGLALKEHATVALMFQKPSTRTRVSFASAIAQLGATPIFVDSQTSQLSRGETIADTARMLSSYCDFIVARLNKHSDLMEIAQNSTVPVINALTELEHPTQALADVYTVRSHEKNLKNVKIAFVGDIATNTVNSLMLTATKMGTRMVLIGPRECKPNARILNKAKEYGTVEVYDSLEDGIDDCDFIYTDTFVSMGEEAEAEARRRMFAPYQINANVIGMAKKSALVLHCLPAHRGEEITSDVLDGPQSIVWEQARNKMLLAKAILLYLSQID